MSWNIAIPIALVFVPMATVTAQPKDEWGDPLPAGALLRMGTSRFRHAGSIYSIAYSVDGRCLVTGNSGYRALNEDSSVILWDARTGQEIRRWHGHAHVVRSVDISPDNKRVAVVNGYGKLVVYDVDTGKEPWQFEIESPERARFSTDGATLYVAGRASVHRLDMKTGKELAALRGHTERVFDVAIARKGNLVATCATDGTVRIYDVDGARDPVHRHTIMIPKKYAVTLAFSSDGTRLAGGTYEHDVHLWDTVTFREIWRVRTDAFRVTREAFSPDGKSLVSAGHQYMRIWDAASGKALHEIKVRYENTAHALFAPDGKRIATAGEHAVIQFWDPATGKEIVRGEGHPRAVSAGAFTPDGKTFATVSDELFIRLWDLKTGKARRFAAEKRPIHAIAFSPDGERLATSAPLSWPALWDLASGRELGRFAAKIEAGHYPGGNVAFAADGKTFASSSSDQRMRLWNVADRKEQLCSFKGKFSDTESLSWTPDSMKFVLAPDGKSFAATRMHRGGEVILWDIAADKERLKLAERGQPVAFTPDGRLIAIVDERHVSLRETATGFEIGRFQTNGLRVINAAFSPDGKSLATVGDGPAVTVWEVATLKQRRVFTGHAGSIRFAAFSPDGRQLASGGDDHTALLWDLTGAAAKRTLDPKECDMLWATLGGADVPKAYQAIWTLAVSANESVPYLHARLKPIAPPDAKRLARLIADLDSASYAIRQQATQELEALGELAAPALRAVPLAKGTLEYRRRVEELLHRARTTAPPPEQLRQLRAIEVLEHARTPAARQVLDAIAQGMPDARLTQDAMAAVQRLAKSANRPPQ